MRNTTDHFFIGGIAGGGLTSRLDGSMDDIRMYDIELSQSQIDTLYNSGSGTEDEEGGDEAAYNVLFFSCNF